jgi:NarL family two-component system response regulator LiaR
MTELVRVVLVDDHHVVRQGLRTYLESFPDLEIVGEAANGEEVLRHIELWLPDVVVMDLLMPGGMDGLETIRRLCQLTPHTQIIALTNYTDDARVIAVLRAGAIGYVRKDAAPDVLLASIRAAARGQSLLDPAVAGAVLQELSHQEKPQISHPL